MSTSAPQGDQYSVVQNVTATAGYAYGVIGADIHVLGNGSPLYVLENYLYPAPIDSRELRELPSRMLNSRYAVVDFTGRESERDNLREWCQNGTRLAVRWLHAPGGQGKTRLAARVAEDLISAGWKVVTAIHGPGATLRPENHQDMRLGDARGLLLIVDYADRWPLTDLTWLLSNALLDQPAIPTRILLLARTAYAWPALRSKLGSYHAGVSDQHLQSLPNEAEQREAVFFTARNSFARHYGILNPSEIAPPARLDQPMWGLILTVHMAALVAVDAHAYDRQPPQDLVGLTAYLLDRERAHWEHLYENRARAGKSGLEFQTSPSVMSRAVFTAALTGPVNYSVGKDILNDVDLGLPSARILTDHTACYPPADLRLATVLEPLYPDRLAEDFLALTLPGHDISAHPADPWAATTAATLLTSPRSESLPDFTPRAITFLAAATARWPHVGTAQLYPLLRQQPWLALAFGGSALTTLADLPTIPIDLLEAFEALFPNQSHVDLDAGIAAVSQRLTDHRLAHTTDLTQRARLYFILSGRLHNAGLHSQSVAAREQAVDTYRRLARADPAGYQANVAESLSDLGADLGALGRHEDALAAEEEAVEIYRRLARADPPAHQGSLAASLTGLGATYWSLNRPRQALAATEQAVETYRQLASEDAVFYLPGFGTSLLNLGPIQLALGRREEALAAAEEAVEVSRALVSFNPATYLPSLAMSMNNLGTAQLSLRQWENALATTQDTVEIYRQLAQANVVVYQPRLGESLNNLGAIHLDLGRAEDALAAVEEAVEIYRALPPENMAAHGVGLATGLNNLALSLAELGQPENALAAAEQAVEVSRGLARENPVAHGAGLATGLSHLARSLAELDQLDEALAASEERVAICRRLARDNSAYEPDLAQSLNNLGVFQSSLGRQEDALATTEQAVQLYRALVQAYPAAHTEGLALSLSSLAAVLAELGRREDALAAGWEAIKLYKRLAKANPATHEANLARSLTRVGAILMELRRPEQALALGEQAVEIYRRLARDNPAAYEPGLASSLRNLGATKSNLGQLEDASTARSQAIGIYRRLAREDPAAYEPDLASSLRDLWTLESTGEAVDIYRRLAYSDPAAHESMLARALGSYALVRAKSHDQLEAALAAAQEAIAIYFRLYERMPVAFARHLGEAYGVAADVLEGLGRTDEAAEIRRYLRR